MKAVIVDASVAAKWFLPEPDAPAALREAGAFLFAPAVFLRPAAFFFAGVAGVAA